VNGFLEELFRDDKDC
jgi:hypothetical protein